ncbi:hypothetical protein DPSP01_002579 [Paraphaeosphaeria sporulosa]
MHPRPDMPISGVSNAECPVRQTDPQPDATMFGDARMDIADIDNLEGVDFDTLPQLMLDRHFIDMDRIIAFEDGSMFAATVDNGMF